MSAQPETELRHLLLSLFDPDQLRMFLADTFGAAIFDAQPVRDTPENLAFHAVQTLRRIGAIDERLFAALTASRPLRGPDITRVQMWFRGPAAPEVASMGAMIA